ncbi:RAMP superfamily CRISPR-associated protein [Rhizobium sp. CECT 9324]|uniref:RAMP superfamily CRISPR-associated protein n=1 Tax=Rhizobium sp. CECT 9324 TaxID=2845820 RepID=UPI001E2840B0|nr:RAMP superfamily CRISPR-associated protein [Rhizobium sp. CECT 9324]CAH0343037.1 hypothetical protein RHI9324_04770 [Rhizobium sp. CECT 9324]
MLIYPLKLSVAGPLMATGLQTNINGIDAPFLRDHAGNFIIPGTQLRGILRHVLEAMAEAAPHLDIPEKIALLFGRPSGSAGSGGFESGAKDWEPDRGHAVISDLIANPIKNVSKTMTRIAVDDFSGSVKPGHLQILEQPVGLGKVVEFHGTLSLQLPEDRASEYLNWLAKALALVPAIGAHKSAGFGRVVDATLGQTAQNRTAETPFDSKTIEAVAEADAAEVIITFDGPFLISAETWNSNLLSGKSRVPGSAIKAVIAQQMGAKDPQHKLHEVLADVIISEFRPSKPAGSRGKTLPLSYFAVQGMDELVDAFDFDPEEWAADGAVVSFQPDWKDDNIAVASMKTQLNDRYEEQRHVRTRTAISKNGTAATGQLFTYSSVIPGEYVWKGIIRRGSASRKAFLALLCCLPERLEAFGKTRTGASLTIAPLATKSRLTAKGRVRIVLETAACLHTPADLHGFSDVTDPSERLRRQYQAYFANALRQAGVQDAPSFEDDSLQLLFFAQQRRVGGYLAARYPVTDEGYYPWLLTVEGSAFEFVLPDGYEQALQTFLAAGLPLPVGFSGHRRRWQGNPFVPENGYGEIRMMSDC